MLPEDLDMLDVHPSDIWDQMEDWRSRIIESGSYHEICQPGHYVLLAQHVTESTQRIPNTRRNAVVTKTRYWHIEPIFDDEQLYALPPALRPKAAGFTEEQVPVPKDEKKKRKKKKEPDYIRVSPLRACYQTAFISCPS